MRSTILFLALLLPSTAFAQSKSCEQLWYERNVIFAEGGLCYSSPLGRDLFGELDCSLRRGGDVLLSEEQTRIITEVREQEEAQNCRINTGIVASPELKAWIATRQNNNTPEEQSIITTQPLENTAPSEGGAYIVCNTTASPLHAEPVALSKLNGVLVNGTFVSAPIEEKGEWWNVTTTIDGLTIEGWLKKEWVDASCTMQNTSEVQSSLAFAYNPNPALPQTRENAIELPDGPNTPTNQANTAWFAFHWGDNPCGLPPAFAFETKSMGVYRDQATQYSACLKDMERQDAITFELGLMELNITLENVAWTTEPQPVLPWDCTTCQAHYESLLTEKIKRDRLRQRLAALHQTQQTAFQTWLRLDPTAR